MTKNTEENPRPDKYAEISDETNVLIKTVINELGSYVAFSWKAIRTDRQKEVIKIVKLNDLQIYLSSENGSKTGIDIVIQVNENLLDGLENDLHKKIRLHEKLSLVHVNLENGKLTLDKPDLTTTSRTIEKYGFENVATANQLTRLVASQQEDKKNDEVSKNMF